MAKFRFKCPYCGEIFDTAGSTVCTKCGKPFTQPTAGLLCVYRMGSPVGVAVGFGIYLDGQPYGYIGNKESLRIPLPYGTHLVHVAQGMNRKCNDVTVAITPDTPVACLKLHIQMGFWSNKFILEPAAPSEMPE